HMTENMSYLTDFEQIDRGYVAFGGNPKGGKIIVPRKNNMYSVDLKNIVPKGGLTCLFAKAKFDESKLWHRRLGYINLKTMNKLVKGNLAEAVNTACYVQNRVLVTKPHNKTPYELFLGRKPALGFMKAFGCLVTILNTINHLGKFDGKVKLEWDSTGFEQIVNFLNARIIKYALTVNPTIYILCIEQFWATVKAKTINGEVQLQALVDGKKIIITESIVRKDLQLKIAKVLQRSRRSKRKDTEVPQPSGSTDNVTDEAVYKELDDNLVRATTTASCLEAEQDSASLGNQEDASKQGRKIDDIDKDVEITLVDETQGSMDMAEKEINVAEKEVSTVDPITTIGEVVTTASTRSTNPKVKGVMIGEQSESTTRIRPQQLPLKDKGKAIMEEPEKPTKRKDQIRHDEEVAQRLQAQMQAELEEEDRLVRQREEEANIVSWDNMQAMIDADYQMAQQMQTEEQDKLSIEEKSKLFQLLEARKKHFAVVRAKEMRNKPPTKARKRNTVSTYVKNMDGYKHNQLKNKSFDDIQKLFDNSMKRVNTFVDMNTELVEGSKKRAGEELMQESAKKQKVDDDKEIVELKSLMEVMPDEEEVALDAIPLAVKSPSIVDWKIHKEGKKSYYQIIKADGSSKMYLVFSHMLKSFDREDLETLYKLVKAKYGLTRPVEDLDLVLYGDLKTMFEPHVEDNVWKNQSDYRVLDWKLYDSFGVHLLRK
ncbi:retrovirus-related pol polyprotein from transposon TNT 1-94, partial [Tanacetum coccineum]